MPTRARGKRCGKCQRRLRTGWLRFLSPCRPGWALATQALVGVNQIQTSKLTPTKARPHCSDTHGGMCPADELKP